MQAWSKVLSGWWALLGVLVLAGHGALAAPGDPIPLSGAPSGSGVAIEIAPGDWGSAQVRDIQVVLDSVASEFRPLVARPAQGVVKIRVVPRGKSPRVLYERGPDGEYVVQLTARDERWFQYAYQFSHELCHILSNFDHKERSGDTVATGNQWFEESLCEAASLFTLRRMAAAWTERPPGRKWIGYGQVFASYAERLLAENHRRLPTNQTLGQWYAENQPALHDNPYLREKNELVATMLLPLFEKDPGMWQAIAFLNANPASAGKSFSEYLADWHGACPSGTQEHVGKTMNLLGVGSATPNRPNWLARLGGQANSQSSSQQDGEKKPPISQSGASPGPSQAVD